MKKNVFIILTLFALAGCSQSELPDSDQMEIKLASVVSNIETSNTRAPIVNYGSGVTTSVLLAKGDATGDYTTSKLLHEGTMTFTDATTAVSFSTPQYYPADGSDVRLCGLYPATDWTVSKTATATATHTFDGKMDLMAAAEVTTNKASSASPKTLTFKHLLTNLVIKAVIDGDATAVKKAWGQITGITLSNAQNTVTVNLKDGLKFGESGPTTTYGGTTAPTFWQADNTTFKDVAFAAIDIPTSATTIAYAMVAPYTYSSKSADVKLTISTTNNTSYPEITTKVVTTGTETTTVGQICTITLKFQTVNIQAKATIENWKTGGSADTTLQ